MHVLDINRCCFVWLLWFFSLLFFWVLLILVFPLRHCSMDFIWIKVSPVFSILMAGLYCCGCLWQHHPEGSIIPDTCPVFSGLFWALELGSHCPSMVERKGGDFPQATVWAYGSTSFSHSFFMNSLTSKFFTEPSSSAAPCPVDSWKFGLQWRQRTMVSKFPFTAELTCVSAAYLTKRRTLSFLASSHLLPTSLALACTEKSKKISAIDKNPGNFLYKYLRSLPWGCLLRAC